MEDKPKNNMENDIIGPAGDAGPHAGK